MQGNQTNLQDKLLKLDNANYKAYKEIRGSYQFENFVLIIDHVQADPFAAPSQLRIIIPQTVGNFPKQLYKSISREIALRDYLARQFAQAADRISFTRGIGKSGLITIAPLGQEILARTSVYINAQQLEVRFVVGLPARGRSILGRQAAELLCQDLPKIVATSLLYSSLNPVDIQRQIETNEDADWLREQLPSKNLVAFIANGAILPRRSGIDARPLLDAVPFKSPVSLQVQFNCPNRRIIEGMGIPAGISLIVGGGYHGKSTLLKAIELGIYNHLPGDGREFVVTNPQGVKIRAEDGRSIAGVDISPFINHLPQGRSTSNFSTTNASGSTSQAANIIEALEAGAQLLLIDEDTSATNFTIRDRRMQALIAKEKEPITPYIDKVRQLYTDYQVSSILVMGGSGDYFEVADKIIALENYVPQDVTKQAKAIALEHPIHRNPEGGTHFGKITPRTPLIDNINTSRGKREVKLKSRGVEQITLGMEEIDLTAVEQIIDRGQLKAIALAIVYAKENYHQQQLTMREILQRIKQDITTSGLNIIGNAHQGDLVMFRPLELASALNRLRSLQIKQLSE
ncbi:ABC transporter ATPase [Chondrocystis sp. NIES-4102]|nr:ABC transporter ATPase [Chondrocystis sp. NIES-4102]